MAKKKRNGGKRKQKIPLLATAGAIITGWGLYETAKTSGAGKSPAGNIDFVWKTTGYDLRANSWSNPMQAVATVAPVLFGVGGSMLMSKLKVNQKISAIPWIKF